MKTNEERLQELMDFLDSLTRIHASDIPGIDLYMDQVTTFMDSHLSASGRADGETVLTKTMINNYAKNRLFPPPVKKKYSENHIIMLILIYYFKNVISFHDIEQLLSPISERHFDKGSVPELSALYEEIFSLEEEQRRRLKEDVRAKFHAASETFADAGYEDREYLRLFAFICELQRSMISFTIWNCLRSTTHISVRESSPLNPPMVLKNVVPLSIPRMISLDISWFCGEMIVTMVPLFMP